MTEQLHAELAKRLSTETSSFTTQKTIQFLIDRFPGKVSFSTSFGVEDQVISDIIFTENLAVKVFTLDTGRHFEETYKVHNRTLSQYNKKIHTFHPNQADVENLLTRKGPLSFYESPEDRKECCSIRKVEPLTRALKGVSIWITGLRSQQSSSRENLNLFEFHQEYNLIKYNPLVNWSLDEVMKYIKDHRVPYNSLYDKGFVSIGCAPCTRAIQAGQDFRAGRWWWENNSGKECGLHAGNNDTK